MNRLFLIIVAMLWIPAFMEPAQACQCREYSTPICVQFWRADAVFIGQVLETKEHMGGFWILEAANLDEALAWAKKAAITCDVPGEVRELLFYPDPKGATE